MTLLWLVNITMPDAAAALGLPTPVLGGWLSGYRDALLQAHPEVSLHFVEPYPGPSPSTVGNHHLVPQSWLTTAHRFPTDATDTRLSPISNTLAAYLLEVNDEVRPDVVHIHGTEFAHSLAWVEACGAHNALISIQGLASVYASYYLGGLSPQERRHCWSVNDWRHRRTLEQLQQLMAQSGQAEVTLLRHAQHVAGRTAWDRAHVWSLSPDCHYYELQEVLRAPFFSDDARWDLHRCQRHTLFMSQGHYPIKGFHRLLDAMPLILRQYPDTQLYLIGQDPRTQHWRHRTEFANVCIRKMRSFGDHVHYVGQLSADQMIEQYRRAHVYVCPSCIENSSNSVCEAQLLGTPVVASYVGGLMDLIASGETGLLYRYEETSMLAQQICRLFADDALAERLSHESRRQALRRHDPSSVAHTLFDIYSTIAHGCR